MDRQLTSFQQECIERLEGLLAALGQKLEPYDLRGETETYVHTRIAGHPIELWIYEDEAAISLPEGGGKIFETPDYDSAGALMTAFVKAVTERMQDTLRTLSPIIHQCPRNTKFDD